MAWCHVQHGCQVSKGARSARVPNSAQNWCQVSTLKTQAAARSATVPGSAALPDMLLLSVVKCLL